MKRKETPLDMKYKLYGLLKPEAEKIEEEFQRQIYEAHKWRSGQYAGLIAKVTSEKP